MKKSYERPIMVCETFTANEYVAACGDSGTVYKFDCNAGSRPYNYTVNIPLIGSVQKEDYYPYDVYLASNEYLGEYGPCSAGHEAESDGAFLKGYMIHQYTDERTEVIIWRGEDGDNIHCTTELDMSKWQTAKS